MTGKMLEAREKLRAWLPRGKVLYSKVLHTHGRAAHLAFFAITTGGKICDVSLLVADLLKHKTTKHGGVLIKTSLGESPAMLASIVTKEVANKLDVVLECAMV